jgi:hypothetical protein
MKWQADYPLPEGMTAKQSLPANTASITSFCCGFKMLKN